MKIRFAQGLFCLCMLYVGFSVEASEDLVFWTNTLGGSWHTAANWSPNRVPLAVTDSVIITNSGTYTVVVTNLAHAGSGILGGSASGTQTLVVDNGATLNIPLFLHIETNGILVMSNATYQGQFIVRTNGQLWLEGTANKTFNSTILYNFNGAVHWRGGTLIFNGSIAQIINDGLWQIECDDWIQPSGVTGTWTNSGILRKTVGTGNNRIGVVDFVNTASGLVDIQTGRVDLYGGNTNVLGGAFNVSSGATLGLPQGTFYDAGGVFTGAGASLFASTTLNLRTNALNGLKLVGGHITLGTNFQQAGAITNLTLDGSILDGTNRVAGTLTVNSGGFGSYLTVQPSGQLLVASSGLKNFANSTLINQGTFTWSGGTIAMGAGTVSNGGMWEITSDDEFYNGGGQLILFTNGGTVSKTAGNTDMTRIEGTTFVNLPGSLIQVDTGTLRLPQNYTNTAGTLRVNGGRLGASPGAFNGFGPLYMTGGTLVGTGTLGSPFSATGGTVAPGFSPGLLQFSSGLTMHAGSTVQIDGTGTTPGSGYDQLSVTGAVDIAGCTLQVTSLPAVSSGTTFTIVQNDAADAVQGTFNGLSENAVVSVNGQSYRLHYAGGTGNDVTLVNESGPPPVGPLLSSGGYANGTFHLLGAGSSSIVYTIQATTNFVQWTNIGAATGGPGGLFNFVDTNASKFRYRFYRTTN